MSANILYSSDALLAGALIVLIAGILIGATAGGGRRQSIPTFVIERQADDSSGVAGMVAVAVFLIVVIAAVVRSL